MVLPEIIINIHPNGDDAWIFDYRLTFEFSDPNDFAQKSVFYVTTTSGVLLDQDHTKHVGVYQGPSFPAVAARPAAPLTINPDLTVRTTRIPMALVRRKLDEFIMSDGGGRRWEAVSYEGAIHLFRSGITDKSWRKLRWDAQAERFQG